MVYGCPYTKDCGDKLSLKKSERTAIKSNKCRVWWAHKLQLGLSKIRNVPTFKCGQNKTSNALKILHFYAEKESFVREIDLHFDCKDIIVLPKKIRDCV